MCKFILYLRTNFILRIEYFNMFSMCNFIPYPRRKLTVCVFVRLFILFYITKKI